MHLNHVNGTAAGFVLERLAESRPSAALRATNPDAYDDLQLYPTLLALSPRHP